MKGFLAAVLAIGVVSAAHADVALTNVTASTTISAPSSAFAYSSGFQFTITAPITVTALGYFDVGGNGLSVSHDVGIWTPAAVNVAAVLLGSATVAATNAAPTDGFHYVTLSTPLSLAAGTYTIGGYSGVNEAWMTEGSYTVNSALSNVEFQQSYFSGTSLAVPDFGGYSPTPNSFQSANVNFQFTVNSQQETPPPSQDVPEPASLALLAAGLLGLRSARKAA